MDIVVYTFCSSESRRTDKSKYYCFYKSHDHSANDCIQLKEEINDLIKTGHLNQYTNDGNRDQEDSSKRKSSTKRVDALSIGKKTTIKEEEE